MSLPAEILDHILSFLQSDLATLKACSRSHPTLSKLVERYLYTDIAVYEGPNIFRNDGDLNDILRRRPYIVSYIHSLEIRFGNGRGPEIFLETFSVILPTLPMLRKIGLDYIGRQFAPSRDWQIPKFRLAFSECLRLPYIMDICIANFRYPLSTLRQCRHIRNLALRRWPNYLVMTDDDNTGLPITIHSLEVQACDPESLSTIVREIQWRHLSSLEFVDRLSTSTFSYLSQILMSCSQSLTRLDLGIGRSCNSYYDFRRSFAPGPYTAIPIPPHVLASLQQLSVHAELDYIHNLSRWGFLSPIPAIGEVLERAVSLKHLSLVFIATFVDELSHSDIYWFREGFYYPLHSLLVQLASSIDCINLQLNGVDVLDPLSAPPDILFQTLIDGISPSVETSTLILRADTADAPRSSCTVLSDDTPLPSASSSTNV